LINPKVVEAFLKRPMENHEWLKKLKRRELLQEFTHELKTIEGFDKLWTHQLVALLLISTFNRFMLHLDMGAGKTSISLFSILARKSAGQPTKAVVFVPYISSVDTWVEEAKTRTPQLKLVPLIGTKIENRRKLEEKDGDVFVICYASAVAMLSKSITKKGKKKPEWSIDPKDTRKAFTGIDTFIADEIHRCGNIQTLTYRMCRAISQECQYGIGLTGTPFGKDKDIADIWSQFYLIDFGETLGETKGLFQEAFFTQKLNHFTKFNEYKFDMKKLPLLKKMVKHNSIHYAATEMHDLPPKQYIKHKLLLPTAIQGYVSIAAAQLIDGIKAGDKGSAEVSYLQLRQLASGFMTVAGQNNDKVKVSFDTNPKLDYLEEKIDGMDGDSKMVVFHHFIYTNHLISNRLTALKIKHARVWSGQRDTLGELKRFRDNKDCRVLILNDMSGSSSLNLQHANYMFFFEQPESPINRQQGEKRIWRAGQQKRVTYIDPFMDKTVDERIFYSNQQGKKLLDQLLGNHVKDGKL
jgi:SNF2 family DNA or RNA helicase